MANYCKLSKIKTNDTIYWIILVSVGVFFLILNIYTPFQHDDYAYAFYYAADSDTIRPTSTPVTWDTLFSSMWHHYLCVNGRFTSHLLIQVFCGLLGKGVFNIFNTFVFIMLLHLLVRFSTKTRSVIALSATILAIFLFIPFPGQTMLWMAGAVNYLWTTTFAIAILFFIQKNDNPSISVIRNVVAFLVGVFVGWMQESITIGLSGGLFVWYLYNRKLFKGTNASVSIGLWVGTICIILSPGTFTRINTESPIIMDPDIFQLITSRLFGISLGLIHYLLPFVALIIACVLLKNKKLRKNMMLPLLVFFMTGAFIYILGMTEARIFYGLVIFSLLLILCFCSQRIHIGSAYLRYAFIMITLTISSYEGVKAFNVAKDYTTYTNEIIDDIKRGKGRVIIKAIPFQKENKWVLNIGFGNDIYSFHNRVRAFYYKKKSVQVLSPGIFNLYYNSLLDSAKESVNINAIYNGANYGVYELPGEDIWLIKLNDTHLPDRQLIAQYTLDDSSTALTQRQKIVRYLLNSLPTKQISNNTFTLSDRDGSYVFFPKKSGVTDIIIK